jgi:hypothetical protein
VITAEITVETDMFEHRNVKPHFINPCCFGEDFADWLKVELSQLDPSLDVSENIQEDYGWGFLGSRGKNRFWIALSYVGDGPQEGPVQWVVSCVPVVSLFQKPDRLMLERLRELIQRSLESNGAIKVMSSDIGDRGFVF